MEWFFDQIYQGWIEIPHNLPSMLVEVLIIGGFVALLANWLSNIAAKRALAREMEARMDDYLRASRRTIVALQKKDTDGYRASKSELYRINAVFDDRKRVYERSLSQSENSTFQTVNGLLWEMTGCLRQIKQQNRDEHIEDYRQRVHESIALKFSGKHPFADLNMNYNKLINGLWGFRLDLVNPRRLKNKKKQCEQLDQYLTEKLKNPEHMVEFPKHLLSLGGVLIDEEKDVC